MQNLQRLSALGKVPVVETPCEGTVLLVPWVGQALLGDVESEPPELWVLENREVRIVRVRRQVVSYMVWLEWVSPDAEIAKAELGILELTLKGL